MQCIPVCPANSVQCFLECSFKRESDTECIIMGHHSWIQQTKAWVKKWKFSPKTTKHSSDGSGTSDSEPIGLSMKSSSPLKSTPKARFLEPNILGGLNFMGKETRCVNNYTCYICVCAYLLNVIFLWEELSVLSMTMDTKFRPPLIWCFSNINYLATGKKHIGLERVMAITSEQLSKNPLCKTKQCQDYSSNIAPEFKPFQ